MARATNAGRTPTSPAGTTYDAEDGTVLESVPATMQEFGRGDLAHDTAADYEIVSYVSVPMLSLRECPPGRTMVCQIADTMHEAPAIEGVKPKYENSPLFICTIKARNGDARVLPCSKVFRSEMDAKYQNGSYVGKWFQITRLPKKEGKNYWTFAIAEVRLRHAA